MMPFSAFATTEAVHLATAPANAFFYAYFSALGSVMPALAPLKSVTRAQGEALKLISRQSQAYLDYSSKLAACRNPQDVLNETKRFWDGAAEQCLDSTQRMIDALKPVSAEPEAPAAVAERAPTHDYVQLPMLMPRRVRQPRPAADYLPVERDYSYGAHA